MWRLCLLLAFVLTVACSGNGGTPSPTSGVVMVFPMEGASMEPTLTNGARLDVLRYTSPVAPGDLIVFRAPTSPTREFLKRVIAGPGQLVEIAGGEVRVDGTALAEPYTKGVTECLNDVCRFQIPMNDFPSVPDPAASPITMTIGEGQPECETTACYFLMGDNRQNSSDSRQGWLVPVQNIVGYVQP